MKWPTKKEREDFEIKGFIEAYRRLSHGRSFVFESEGECPDRIVKDIETGENYGIELTSVYLDDRSVPNTHVKDETIPIPYDANQVKRYEKRILVQIIDKVCKARSHYTKCFPLILSVYVNEYIKIILRSKIEMLILIIRYFRASAPNMRLGQTRIEEAVSYNILHY